MPKSVWSLESQILADALSQARREAGLHQADVAKVLDKDQTIISNIERGQRRIDLVEFRDFSLAVGRDPAEFYAAILEKWAMAR